MRPGRSIKMNREDIKINFSKKSYVDSASNVMKYYQSIGFKVPSGKRSENLTNTQLRNFLAITSSIYNIVMSQGPEAVRDKLLYFKIHLIYQAGRNVAVKDFVELSKLPAATEKVLSKLDDDDAKEYVICLCRYMEALVAYFKYYGGKD